MSNFHVVVVQRWKRNVKKNVMHVQSCCFVFKNLSFFAVLCVVPFVVGFVFILK